MMSQKATFQAEAHFTKFYLVLGICKQHNHTPCPISSVQLYFSSWSGRLVIQMLTAGNPTALHGTVSRVGFCYFLFSLFRNVAKRRFLVS
jgi:hypothetical protein